MTVTTLDPTTALLVIDFQRGIADIPAVHPIPDVVGRASALATHFAHTTCLSCSSLLAARHPVAPNADAHPEASELKTGPT